MAIQQQQLLPGEQQYTIMVIYRNICPLSVIEKDLADQMEFQ